MLKTKVCTKCGKRKFYSDFYKSKTGKGGRGAACKDCHKEQIRAYNQTEKGKALKKKRNEKYQKTEKGNSVKKKSYAKWSKSEKGKELRKKSHLKWSNSEKGKTTRSKYSKKPTVRQKIYARASVYRSVKRGDIPQASTLQCDHCPNPAEQYHHYLGYKRENWLDVMPLCIKCHNLTD